MTEAEKKKRAEKFVKDWLSWIASSGSKVDVSDDDVSEEGNDQNFWRDLLQDVLDAPRDRKEFPIRFQKKVRMEVETEEEDEEDEDVKNTLKKIDVFLPTAGAIIEHKSPSKKLDKKYPQSDNKLLTPFQQGYRYAQALVGKINVRWIVACNFSEFWIYDLKDYDPSKHGNDPTLKIFLKDLPKKLHLLKFLTAGAEEAKHIETPIDEKEISVKAGEIVARIYKGLLKSSDTPEDPETLRSLNIFCVRLVFCLYAENAGLFAGGSAFRDYLSQFDVRGTRHALIRLFDVLNTPEEKRDKYLQKEDPKLAEFPYVNGGLFADLNAEVPPIDEDTRRIILEEASAGLDWSGISPTIFGAVFESTLNPETRRKGGMHYTSPENIHKVIDPLFLDDLKTELNDIERARISEKERARELFNFQEKLASLKFLDPACGSGNFLTETYLELRELENRAIKSRMKDVAAGQRLLGGEVENPVRVSISQFYGIEINDFAVSVAKTAMWIAECKMLKETEKIISREINFLPLASYANIAEGNALKMDWARLEVLGDLSHFAQRQAEGRELREPVSYDYIFGNPPFVGWTFQTEEQKEDMISVWRDEQGKPYDMTGRIDYVACWFFKAAELMKGTNVRTALVATNSIVQGEPVAALWKPLFERFGIHIDFAHRTFRWDSESNDKAHVHCVVVGFSSAPNAKPRIIFDGDTQTIASNINAYLMDAPDVFVERRSKPLCDIPEMGKGSQPTDDGNFLFVETEKNELLKKEPGAEKFVKKFVGSEEFINGRKRWCLWLVDATPGELRAMPEVIKRVEAVREFRLASKKKQTREDAKIPTLFQAIRQPTSDYVVIPEVSSEKRRYVPMGFLSSDIICSNLLLLVPNATPFHFGVLTSDVHMAWMRAVCGRLEMRYRYSGVVYNNFPWASADEEQNQKISATAQGIIDARAKFPNQTLADLYDDRVMPKELRDAHDANDKAVRKLFGFSRDATEAEIVRELFQRYSEMTKS